MNASDLAARMLEWEETQRKADALRSEIEAAVLEIGKTQTVGNVRASYSEGRKSFDYGAAVMAAVNAGAIEPGAVQGYRTVSFDYRMMCKDLSIVDVPYTQSEPSVSVKLVA